MFLMLVGNYLDQVIHLIRNVAEERVHSTSLLLLPISTPTIDWSLETHDKEDKETWCFFLSLRYVRTRLHTFLLVILYSKNTVMETSFLSILNILGEGKLEYCFYAEFSIQPSLSNREIACTLVITREFAPNCLLKGIREKYCNLQLLLLVRQIV